MLVLVSKFIDSFIHSFIHSLIHSFFHLFIHLFIYLFEWSYPEGVILPIVTLGTIRPEDSGAAQNEFQH